MKKQVKNTYHPERINNAVVESEKEYSKICYDIQSFGVENLKHCQYCPFKKVCLYHIGCSANSLSHYITDQYPKKWTTLIPLAHATNKDVRYFFDDRFDESFTPSVFCLRDLHKRFCDKLNKLTDGSVQTYYGQACGLSRSTASRNYTEGVNSIEIFLEHLNELGIDIVDLWHDTCSMDHHFADPSMCYSVITGGGRKFFTPPPPRIAQSKKLSTRKVV